MINNKQDDTPSVDQMKCSGCERIYNSKYLEPYVDDLMLRMFCPLCLDIKKSIDKHNEKLRKEKIRKNKSKVPRVQNPEKGV